MSPRRQVVHSIRGRVLTLGLVGTVIALGLMILAGRTLTAELERAEGRERELRARMVADRLDRALTGEIERLAGLGAEAARLLSDPAGLRPALHTAQRRSGRLFDHLFLLRLDGTVLIEEPLSRIRLDGAELVRRGTERRRPVLTPVYDVGEGRSRVFALVPVRSGPGEIVAVLGAGMDPEAGALEALLATPDLEASASIDLVDTGGIVFASTDPRRRHHMGDRDHQLANLITQRRAWSGLCHDCHEEAPHRSDEQFALSPLITAPWGVKVRQPDGPAHAFAASVAGSVTAAGGGLVLVMMVFAWGAARAVTRPLESLTDSAERLARGGLDEPIPELPADEIGRLGNALERMRVALRDALHEVARTNQELEARVASRTQELAQVNAELEVRSASRAEALRQVITAQEEERRRIARELHDETSQSLAALAITLDGVSRERPLDDETRTRLSEASGLAVRTLEAVHGLCRFLRPPVLDDLGLPSAIQWFSNVALGTKGVSVRCEFSGLDVRLPREVETAIFRCAQEAMTNIARHANAETVLVQCLRKGRTLILEVEDDGVGFEPHSVGAAEVGGRGLGLLGIRERVELLEGKVAIVSAPGEGTRVAIEIPLGEEVPDDDGERGAGGRSPDPA